MELGNRRDAAPFSRVLLPDCTVHRRAHKGSVPRALGAAGIRVRSEHWPAQIYTIKPYAAEEFPSSFTNAGVSVKTLEALRTFWEKATILHAEFHRMGDAPGVGRLSRHYYDLAMLARSPVRATALDNMSLLTAVAEHKRRFFRAAWARYEKACPGTLKLVPHERLTSALRADYRKMSEMFFDEPPDFDTLLDTLAELEAAINDRP